MSKGCFCAQQCKNETAEPAKASFTEGLRLGAEHWVIVTLKWKWDCTKSSAETPSPFALPLSDIPARNTKPTRNPDPCSVTSARL